MAIKLRCNIHSLLVAAIVHDNVWPQRGEMAVEDAGVIAFVVDQFVLALHC